MNKMDDLERFDDDTNTIETMTELTGVTGDTGFSSTTSNAPTSESDFTTMPTEKKKNILPLVASGALGLCFLAGMSFWILGSDEQSNNQEVQVESEQVQTPTATVPNEQTVQTEEKTDNGQQVPTLDDSTNANNNSSQPQPNLDSVVVKPEQSNISTSVNTDQQNIVSAPNSNKPIDNNAEANKSTQNQVQSVLPQEQNIPVQPIDNSQTAQNGNTPQITNNSNTATLESEKLREEAKKMLAQADALDNKGSIESLLIGKSPDEQILILKQKLEDVKLELSKRQVCKNTEKKNSHFNKKSVKTNKQNKKTIIKESKYNVTGIVEGQIWVKNGSNTHSYVVGDRLPNGSKIKAINFDNKTIVTERGTFKVN